MMKPSIYYYAFLKMLLDNPEAVAYINHDGTWLNHNSGRILK